MNIAGIGIDATEIHRFGAAIERYGRGFLEKIFTENELEHARGKQAYAMHLAGKFAAKEAVKKALPDGAKIGLRWYDIEILNSEDGKPYAVLHGRAAGLKDEHSLSHVLVSISHTRDIATSNAMAVANG